VSMLMLKNNLKVKTYAVYLVALFYNNFVVQDGFQ
jgi:hypothetical protein